MLRASRNGNTNQFIIRRFVKNHSCALDVRFKGQRQATTSIIADTIKSKFTNIKTTYTVADIIRDMRNDHNINVNYNKAWRSKEKALENMRGNATASYAELYTYLFILHNTNAGSITELQLTVNSCFMYVFIALHASIKGWNYCLPVVVVDGTFLKSAYGGTLLVAATQDTGGRIVPLAFAVVDSENDLSWEWFFTKFRKAYGGREDMLFVSDRHESIIKGASKVYHEVHPTNEIFFEVHNKEKKYMVDLSKRTCSCNRFQMDNMPCYHAIAVLKQANMDLYEYCFPYYKKETMIATYKDVVYPVGNKDCWKVSEEIKSVEVYPPEGRIKVGRPKKRRCKAHWEKNGKARVQYGKCNQIGHNRRTWRNPMNNN
ncbi:uncharacterized protein LOC141679222 [Apium graveolens]|uniref:uncharacterized protein LOC141679222 n=1 Tax=Apium graveolens TaxID=4045 RepID=UPI003D7A1157